MTRTFISLELDREMQSHLKQLLLRVAPSLPAFRWVQPESIHLTLAFLGELNKEELHRAFKATEIVAQQSLPIIYSLKQVGIFGPIGRPRVIWAGIEEGANRLPRLYKGLQQELRRRGFATPEERFEPHLTLGRGKMPLTEEQRGYLEALLAEKRLFQGEYEAKQIEVMKSELTTSGPRYTTLRTYPFLAG
jgi:2'-5' RNA ligase